MKRCEKADVRLQLTRQYLPCEDSTLSVPCGSSRYFEHVCDGRDRSCYTLGLHAFPLCNSNASDASFRSSSDGLAYVIRALGEQSLFEPDRQPSKSAAYSIANRSWMMPAIRTEVFRTCMQGLPAFEAHIGLGISSVEGISMAVSCMP
eukprot:5114694-Prymnesium_polylepis.1